MYSKSFSIKISDLIDKYESSPKVSQPSHGKNIGRQHSIPEEGDDKTQAGDLREGFLVLTGMLLYYQFV